MKKFLSTRGVEFESIDIAASATGRNRLEQLGFRSVPVVSIGNEAVHGIDLNEVAQLVGLKFESAPTLEPEELQARLTALLRHIQAIAPQLDSDFLDFQAPGRNRSMLSLVNHVVEIATVFLRVATGESLDESMANAEPEELLQPEQLLKRVDTVIAGIRSIDASWTRRVTTYFGTQSLHQILERTTWHSAQHLRQLEYLADRRGATLKQRLSEAHLDGLSLPCDIWDGA